MSKIKIVLLGKLPPPFMGPAVATDILLHSRLSESFQLIHLDTSDHRGVESLGRMDPVNVFLAIKQYLDLFKILIKHNPALVYIPSQQTTVGFLRDVPFICLSKIFGKKVLCHLRGGNFKNWYESTGFFMRWIVRAVLEQIDGQIVLGENLVHIFDWAMPRDKIFVVPNGGNFNISSSPSRNENVRILFLSNLRRSKGAMDVLHAVPLVTKKYQDISFVFAGNWRNEETRLYFERYLLENPGLPIEIRGPVCGREKFDLLASSDIFVMPTYYPNEGHPWVIVEAMAAGLPVIATDHAAITQSVKHGVNGFIVEKKDPVHLAEAILKMASDQNLRGRMGRESRRLYEEGFTEDRMIGRLTSAIRLTLGN